MDKYCPECGKLMDYVEDEHFGYFFCENIEEHPSAEVKYITVVLE